MQIETSAGSSPSHQSSIIVWVDDQGFHGLHGHTIGRDEVDSITVDHAQVSRRHAILEHGTGGWYIRDLDSTNGLHDGTGRHEQVSLPPGRTQVWLGPPETSPCIYFDVTMPGGTGSYAPEPEPQPAVPQPQPSVPQSQPSAPQPQPSAPQSQPQPSARPSPPGASDAPPAPHTRSLYTPPQHVGDRSRSAGPQSSAPAQASLPPPPVLNSVALQASVGQHSQVIRVQTQDELVIGRASDCDISIPDPLVSRRHARLILHGGSGRIVDLGSDNGTFVNGQRVSESEVAEGDLIEMGKAQFILTGGQLQQHVAHGLPLQADGLTVIVGGGLRLLNEVSFTLPAGSMTAIVGPSGSGKTTLLNAITGRRKADTGRVFLGGRDLYASDEGLGRRIGFVPQDDPVHASLSVRHALVAATRLRLPADVSNGEIKANVERVAAELGLSERLDTKVQALSGGQRKRVSVGYELVGEPQALILDEPTSGLDPGLERELMNNLRQLTDKGTTTIVVTHSVQSVEFC
ncbi:MAG: FHA domain-containing protein, partial [Actinomycetia bacterium]|nr:FHA domain-containing protein [Actinomycetes bacterium]